MPHLADVELAVVVGDQAHLRQQLRRQQLQIEVRVALTDSTRMPSLSTNDRASVPSIRLLMSFSVRGT